MIQADPAEKQEARLEKKFEALVCQRPIKGRAQGMWLSIAFKDMEQQLPPGQRFSKAMVKAIVKSHF
eukprot:3479060-Lingulodinium_polyedra.AAC.1